MEIRLLLEKYKNFGFSQKRIREITNEVFLRFSIQLDEENIRLNDSEIRIQVSGSRKVEYLLLKSKIQEMLFLEFEKEGFKIRELL
jgi:hypothetical protein